MLRPAQSNISLIFVSLSAPSQYTINPAKHLLQLKETRIEIDIFRNFYSRYESNIRLNNDSPLAQVLALLLQYYVQL